MIITKYLLFQALVTGGSLTTNDVHFKLITTIEREEGSLRPPDLPWNQGEPTWR